MKHSAAARKKMSEVQLAKGDAHQSKTPENRRKNSEGLLRHYAKFGKQHIARVLATKRDKPKHKLTCEICGKGFKSWYPRVRFCDGCKAPHPCACGCRKLVNQPDAPYVQGHSPATRAKLRRSLKLAFKRDPSLGARNALNRKSQAQQSSKVERVLHAALDKRIFRLAGQNQVHYGQPISADIIAPKVKLIVQVDGCYWHECPKHGSGKFPDKADADKRITRLARKAGWTVLRFWEHDVRKSLDKVVRKIQRVYTAQRK